MDLSLNSTDHPFYSDFVRVASVSPELVIADVGHNVEVLQRTVSELDVEGAGIVVCPELALTGYTCGDLFYQEPLLQAAREGLLRLREASKSWACVVIVGLPFVFRGRLYNCGAAVQEGRILGIVPKTFLPARYEYYEPRWFTSGAGLGAEDIELDGERVLFGTRLLFEAKEGRFTFGIELCEDLWAANPLSGDMALAGATLIANLSASVEILEKARYRRSLVVQQSGRCLAGYVYASAGPCESTTDVVFSGHCLIAENGKLLAENKRFVMETNWIIADLDIDYLTGERLRNSSFSQARSEKTFTRVVFDGAFRAAKKPGLMRRVERLPFVPSDPAARAEHCQEIVQIQSVGLARRLRHVGLRDVVIGISGGLDSTLALLICVEAFHKCSLDLKGIHAVTLPGLGTTSRTKTNAWQLMEALGVDAREISIHSAVEQHFRDIGHDRNVHDATFENAQARERTQILMDLANKLNGLVVGTGDLSEAALGWCTFNGDHMSMYHVNIGIPKTLVQYLVAWCADELFQDPISAILRDILATPISPELLPLDAEGNTMHSTEELVGPYELHDFFLFYSIRCGFRPEKVLAFAQTAFGGTYSADEICNWLDLFYRRFFSQQFKRNSMPDGPKIGTLALSPRGDWRMPSDAGVGEWLEKISS